MEVAFDKLDTSDLFVDCIRHKLTTINICNMLRFVKWK